LKTILLPKLIIASLLSLLSISPATAQQGYLDTTFGTNGIVTLGETVKPYAIWVQQDGKVLVAGSITEVAPFADYFICRLHTDGTLDNNFGSDGMVVITQSSGSLNGIAEMPDGSIVAMGTKFQFIRLSSAGVLDTSLGQNGILQIDMDAPLSSLSSSSMKLLQNGKILASGLISYNPLSHPSARAVMVRLNSDLSIDTSFSGDGIFNSPNPNVHSFTGFDVAANGSIIASVRRVLGINAPRIQLVKLTEDGYLAPSFGSAGVALVEFGTASDAIRDVNILDSGKILISGKRSTSTPALARMHNNGVYDESYGSSGLLTFSSPPEAYYSAFASWELGDGGIVSVVDRSHDGFYDYGLMFTHENGEIDIDEGINGFAMTPLSAQYLTCSIRQPDGKIFVAGYDANGLILVRYNTEANLRSESFDRNSLQVYPNPATESITLTNLPDNTVISLQDISGKKLFEAVSNGETVLDLSSLTAGIYFVTTPYGTKKIVKQ
jgi:uncharacterized delta-60 repeat protein